MNQIVAEIIVATAERYGFTYEDILGKSKTLTVVKARQEAMVEARKRGFSYPELGKFFGVDHTTVLHAVRKAEGRMRRRVA